MLFRLKNDTCTAIVDSYGGELVSFQDCEGTEYIWSGDPAYWSGRNPILFPIVGGLKNGCIRFSGMDRDYKMSRHGFARRSEFSFVEREKDYAVFELSENAETLTQYPFHFLLRIRHQLLNDGFTTQYEIENTGERPMPFCIGAHTAFRCPLHESERFEDYHLIFDEEENVDMVPLNQDDCLCHNKREPGLRGTVELPLAYHKFDRLDTLVFDHLKSKGVALLHRDTGHGIHVEFDGFPMLAFWTKPHSRAPFLCIEPWHGCDAYDNESGAFEDKPFCITLPQNEKKVLEYHCRIL